MPPSTCSLLFVIELVLGTLVIYAPVVVASVETPLLPGTAIGGPEALTAIAVLGAWQGGLYAAQMYSPYANTTHAALASGFARAAVASQVLLLLAAALIPDRIFTPANGWAFVALALIAVALRLVLPSLGTCRGADAIEPARERLDGTTLPEHPREWTTALVRLRRMAAVKRLFDVVAALGIGVVTAPVMLLCALAVRLSSPGPVLYTQQRVGRGGRLFTMFKFRSMRADAERSTGATWASVCDPRVTAVGRLIRRYRIDELPQLWNVVAGQMSLVGPRPERPELSTALHAALPRYGHRLLVKPGITGWAQVRYVYTDSIDSARTKLAYDLDYVERMSLLFDVRICLETVRVILNGLGGR